jgi:hypothetical protein
MKISPVVTELLQTEKNGRTDIRTEITKLQSLSTIFSNALERILYEGREQNNKYFHSNDTHNIT